MVIDDSNEEWWKVGIFLQRDLYSQQYIMFLMYIYTYLMYTFCG